MQSQVKCICNLVIYSKTKAMERSGIFSPFLGDIWWGRDDVHKVHPLGGGRGHGACLGRLEESARRPSRRQIPWRSMVRKRQCWRGLSSWWSWLSSTDLTVKATFSRMLYVQARKHTTVQKSLYLSVRPWKCKCYITLWKGYNKSLVPPATFNVSRLYFISNSTSSSNR